jgi:macrolide-specific efflux system membrane fusion protein
MMRRKSSVGSIVLNTSEHRFDPHDRASTKPAPAFSFPLRRLRRAPIAIAIIAILLAVYVAGSAKVDPLANYEFRTIEYGSIENTVAAIGKIRPKEYVDVGAQTSGQLKRILVKPGDKVHEGDLLAEIDSQVLRAKVAADEAELSRLRATLADQQAQADYLRDELERQLSLRLSKSNSEAALALAKRDAASSVARLDAVRAEIEQAQSNIKMDQMQLGYTRIYAPMDGTVVSVAAIQGQTINATYSTPLLLRIANLSVLTVWTLVSEADVTRLKQGMPLYFTTLGYGDRQWSGTLRQILPAPFNNISGSGESDPGSQSMDRSTNTVVFYTALFDVPNENGELRPDMTAQVFFIIASAANAALLPIEALGDRTSDGHGLIVKVLGKASKIEDRMVRVGIRNRFMVQIESGLSPDDKVVTGIKPNDVGSRFFGFLM